MTLSPSSSATLKLSELIASLSYALDITEGQSPGHCLRCCWVGMHIGRQAGLSDKELWELYYVVLLKDLGCSSNAARICEMYLTDDRNFKRDWMLVGDSLPQVLGFVLKHTGLKAGLAERFRNVMRIVRDGRELQDEFVSTRCQRGAEIARLLRFPDAVSRGIYSLDEHFNGNGKPEQLKGEAIPVYSRIALMAQVVDVFHTESGREAAMKEVRARAGQWFDPRLVAAFEQVAASEAFWRTLGEPDIERAVTSLPAAALDRQYVLDDDYLDDIATAFGQVVDAKSPYTSGHSARVALYTDMIAEALGLSAERRRWLKRGALLHDVGKLGVSNSVLDKAGALDAAEWAAVKEHAHYTEAILGSIGAFRELAAIAGSHHEKLDGTGYPRGLSGDQISIETRIITTADIFDAITAERPYRGAIPIPQALAIMRKTVGTALDADCFEALVRAVERVPFPEAA